MPPEPWEGCPRFPLQTKDGYLLAELVVAPPVGRALSIYEQDFLEGLALQAGVALENARYHERNLEWTRVQRDLEAARLIQRSLLPQQMPEIAGYSIAFRSTACYEVGGDYVDIVELPGGAQIMAVADVAGKGLASAIVEHGFRAGLSRDCDRRRAAGGAGRAAERPALCRGRGGAAAVCDGDLLRLEPATHTLEVVNAGHNPGFLLTAGRQPHSRSSPAERRSAWCRACNIPRRRFAFPSGSRLLFYTDGLTEVFQG